MGMNMNDDLFVRRLFSTIESIANKIFKNSKVPRFTVGTITAVYGTYPTQTADVLLPSGDSPVLNIQNASIHSLSVGDQVYVQMIYGDLTCPVITIKKL
jgi:hypothetical protein